MTDPAMLARHAMRALSEHAVWCRRNGVTMPAELSALLDVLTVGNRQEPTGLAPSGVEVDPVLVDLSTAARRLSVSRRTVERMTADGRLPSTRVGRRRLVVAAALTEHAGGGR